MARNLISSQWQRCNPSCLFISNRISAISRPSPFEHAARAFTTTPHLSAKKKGGKQDSRIALIRYHLQHPLTPRPLRFSRLRALRHWTIHRAWQLFRAKQRKSQELELERQYNSMRDACETLRLMDDDGIAHTEQEAEGKKSIGRLYRVAMHKRGVWEGMPIEYARAQTEFPPRDGWNSGWKR